MSERPEQRPEGALIGRAQKRSGLSQREAAARAGISEAHWRNIVKGYQTVSAGVAAPIRGAPYTIARMAQGVGVTPEQLTEAGRADAAEELRGLPPIEEEPPEPTVAELAAELAALKQQNEEIKHRNEAIERRLAELEERRKPDQAAG